MPGHGRSDFAPDLRSFPVNRLRATVFCAEAPASAADAILVVRVLRQEHHADPDAFA